MAWPPAIDGRVSGAAHEKIRASHVLKMNVTEAVFSQEEMKVVIGKTANVTTIHYNPPDRLPMRSMRKPYTDRAAAAVGGVRTLHLDSDPPRLCSSLS